MNVPARTRVAAVALVAAGTLWGASFLFGKLAIAELHVAHVVLYRSLLASAALLPFALLRPERPRAGDLPLFMLTGFLTIPATFLLQYAGLERTSATSATLIVGALPPLLALAATRFSGERLNGVGWAAVVASTAGVALVVGLPSGGRSWTGDLLVFLSMLVVVAWVLLSKRLLERYSPAVTTAYIHAFGTLTLLPIALLWGGTPDLDVSPGGWAAVSALGLGCSAATNALWNWSLKYVPVSRAGMYANVEPLVGVALAAAVLHEPLGPGVLLGGVLIVGAAGVATAHED
jgi:drug/metabolite transporter (DMT)-like permease